VKFGREAAKFPIPALWRMKKAGSSKTPLGYARIYGKGIDYVLTTPHVLLGALEGNGRVPCVKIGKHPIEDKHLDIHYNFQTREFELFCIAQAGAMVNDKYVGVAKSVSLKSRDRIAIPGTSCRFTFLLPVSSDAEKGPEPAAPRQTASHTKDTEVVKAGRNENRLDRKGRQMKTMKIVNPDTEDRQHYQEQSKPNTSVLTNPRSNAESTVSKTQRKESEKLKPRSMSKISQISSSRANGGKRSALSAREGAKGSTGERDPPETQKKPPRGRKRKIPWDVHWCPGERERFQRVLLTYGFPRPGMIKKGAGLTRRGESEIMEYTIAFVQALCKRLSGEERNYLLRASRDSKVPESALEPHASLGAWEKMKRSANVWGRRLCNLHFLGEMARSGNDVLSLIPTSFFSGQKPTEWWGRNDDKALLEGTYKHGYARYDSIKIDKSLGFTAPEERKHSLNDKSKKDGWPSADVLTRRLKRLIELSRKTWRKRRSAENSIGGQISNGDFKGHFPGFERMKRPEMTNLVAKRYVRFVRVLSTGKEWKLTDREALTEAIMTHPIYVDSGGRMHIGKIKRTAKLTKEDDKDLIIFVQLILWELSQFLADRKRNRTWGGGPLKLPPIGWDENQLNQLADRVSLLCRNAKCVRHPSLYAALNEFAPTISATEPQLPTWWEPVTHDIALMKGVEKHGFGKWDDILHDSSLGWAHEKESKDKSKSSDSGDEADDSSPDLKQELAKDPDLCSFVFEEEPLHNSIVGSQTEYYSDDESTSKSNEAKHPKPSQLALASRLKVLVKGLRNLYCFPGEYEGEEAEEEALISDGGDTGDEAAANGFAKKPLSCSLLESFFVEPALPSDPALPPTVNRTAKEISRSKGSSGASRRRTSGNEAKKRVPGYKDKTPNLQPVSKGLTLNSKKLKQETLGWGQGVTLQEEMPSPMCVSSSLINAKKLGIAEFSMRNPIRILYRDRLQNPTFPMRITEDLCLYRLGEFSDKTQLKQYHTREFIFFPGYMAVREHQSMVKPDRLCKYKCAILHSDEGPLFQVTCEDCPSKPIVSHCADDAWLQVANETYLASDSALKERIKKINGYERFGLCNETITAIIQEHIAHMECEEYEPIAVGPNTLVN